ncbi:MAG: hypothetical protein C0605_07740 [Hyphomicrobiales bacterium]|nr:MAG: hypothetical protein C0605_07740 [Hyphomicrobiales bacterium]
MTHCAWRSKPIPGRFCFGGRSHAIRACNGRHLKQLSEGHIVGLKSVPSRLKSLSGRLKVPPKKADAFYQSKAWRRLAAIVKRERGNTCEQCGATNVRLIADHIIEIKDGGDRLSRRNIQVLCYPCHNRKTATAARQRVLGG